jgi:hypothetical protein
MSARKVSSTAARLPCWVYRARATCRVVPVDSLHACEHMSQHVAGVHHE